MEYVQLVCALIGVLALIFLFFWILRKVNKGILSVSGKRNMRGKKASRDEESDCGDELPDVRKTDDGTNSDDKNSDERNTESK